MSKDEKEFVESIRLQLSLLDTLGNNFIDIALINVEDERVTLIKTQSKQNSVQLDAKYSSICKESIQKYVNKNKQQALIQKLSLNQIRFELSKSKEYSVNFCGIVHEQNRYYQVKYIYLFDLEHILMIFKRLDNQYSDVENLRKERAFLDVLCRDYTSVYYYNSQDDALEVLKMGENSNEVHLIGKEIRVVYKYTDEMKRYCENFVVKNQKEEFLKVMRPESIIERLSKNARYVYRFESKPNNVGQHYFECVPGMA